MSSRQRVDVHLTSGEIVTHDLVRDVRLYEGALILDSDEPKQVIYAAGRWDIVQSAPVPERIDG